MSSHSDWGQSKNLTTKILKLGCHCSVSIHLEVLI